MWSFLFFAHIYLVRGLIKCGSIYQIKGLELPCISQRDWISANLIIAIFECEGKISESAQDAAVLDMYEWVSGGGDCVRDSHVWRCVWSHCWPACSAASSLHCRSRSALLDSRQRLGGPNPDSHFWLHLLPFYSASLPFFFYQIHEYREGNTFVFGMKDLMLLETKMPWG